MFPNVAEIKMRRSFLVKYACLGLRFAYKRQQGNKDMLVRCLEGELAGEDSLNS